MRSLRDIVPGFYDDPVDGVDEIDEHECADCGEPVGWALAEIADTYDSGHEAPRWFPVRIVVGVLYCEDCGFVCRWFAACDNDADGTVAHPVLGGVPCCQRCADRVGETITNNEGA